MIVGLFPPRHSPASSIEESMFWPADASAFRTAERTSSTLASFVSGWLSGAATTAGAADSNTPNILLTPARDRPGGPPAVPSTPPPGAAFRPHAAPNRDKQNPNPDL